MAQHRDIDDVRISWIDHDASDRLRIGQPHLCECLPGVRRLINAVSKAGTLPVVRFAGAHPHDVRVRGSDRDISNGRGRISIENRRESRAIVRGFPDAAGGRADVANV